MVQVAITTPEPYGLDQVNWSHSDKFGDVTQCGFKNQAWDLWWSFEEEKSTF